MSQSIDDTETLIRNAADWKTFRESGLLWWVNRALHIFGWAIVCEVKSDGTVTGAYPARVSYRGFSRDDEEDGFKRLHKYLEENAGELGKDVDRWL